MNWKEAKKYLEDNNYPNGRCLKLTETSKHRDFILSAIELTSFLDEVYDNVSIASRCYAIVHDIFEVPSCKVCGSKVDNSSNYIPGELYTKNGFREYCSKRCTAIGTTDKRSDTVFSNTGFRHQMHNPESIKKLNDTNNERYGTPYFFQSEKFFENLEITSMERYNTKHPSASERTKTTRKKNLLEKRGVENVFQLEEVKQKSRTTCRENSGFDNPSQNPEVQKSKIISNNEKYGFDHPNQSPIVQEKRREKEQRLNGVDNASQRHYTEEYLKLISSKESLEAEYRELGSSHAVAKKYGIGSQRTILLKLKEYGIEINDPSKTSSYEKELCRFLDSHGIEYETGNRELIKPKEIDILIHKHKIAIEVNGSYYHSDKFKTKKYHQEKSLAILAAGYKPIHIHEHMFNNEKLKNIMFTKILYHCGVLLNRVFARKCQVVEIKNSDLRDFYDSNHIQGFKTSKISYALMYDHQIVGAISFSGKEGKYEIDRYCTSIPVVGGFSRLLSKFKKENHWSEIKTYASLEYGDGSVYKTCGFKQIGITGPNYFYIDGPYKFSRQYFMKHKLKDRLDIYDESMTEKQLMDMNGYLRVYDSGSLIYILENKKGVI